MPEQLLTGNVGEWSEVYVFFHIMGCHELVPCDGDLTPLAENHLPVLAIYRGKGPKGKLSYVYKNEDDGIWEIQLDGTSAGTVPAAEGHEQANALLAGLLTAIKNHKKGSLQFPKAQKFLERLCDSRLKAKSTKKEDISLKLRDLRAGQTTTCGFSIKSYMGSEPTLLNSSGNATNFLCHVSGISSAEADEINRMATTIKNGEEHINVQTVIQALKDKKAEVTFHSLLNGQFAKNLRYVDTSMARLLGELVRTHYMTWQNKLSDVTDIVAEKDCLSLDDPELYRHMVKMFLEAVAFGMTPAAKCWKGVPSATGGFLIVKPDGELVTYHLYNREALDEYLLRYTKFEHPSTKRHKYGKIYPDENGQLCLNLALQIRFCKPNYADNLTYVKL